MKIAINTIPLLSPLTGVGNYTYQMARLLPIIAPENSYSYFYGYFTNRLLVYKDNSPFYYIKEFIEKVPFLSEMTRKAKGIVNYFTYKNFDLYFEPNFIPINIKAKHIIATVHDFSFNLHPQWHPKDRILYFKRNFSKNIKRVDKIIVDSNFIKQEAINLFGVPEDKLIPIYLGVDKDIFKPYPLEELQDVKIKYALPENFILFVGSIEPRKNIEGLLKAYICLKERTKDDLKLVLVGFKGWKNNKIMELIKKIKEDIIYLGYLPDAELGKLYNLATAFAYPSIYEGFGLPPLEAMACGCPVITSNIASLPEVCGNSVYYVNPYETDDIAEGIYKIITNEELKKGLVQRGLERAKFFSWEKSATEHLRVFEEVCSS
jgi:glycosyltransferase involved in cell wall biosynthesis